MFHFSPEANISGILAFLQGIMLFNNVVTTLDLSNSDDIYTSLHKHTISKQSFIVKSCQLILRNKHLQSCISRAHFFTM